MKDLTWKSKDSGKKLEEFNYRKLITGFQPESGAWSGYFSLVLKTLGQWPPTFLDSWPGRVFFQVRTDQQVGELFSSVWLSHMHTHACPTHPFPPVISVVSNSKTVVTGCGGKCMRPHGCTLFSNFAVSVTWCLPTHDPVLVRSLVVGDPCTTEFSLQ